MAEKKDSVYTPAIIAELAAIEGLNWEKAQAFAEKHGLKARGVVTSAKRNEIPYFRQERKTKTGVKITTKSELVALIAKKTGVAIEKLDGLEKATKTALEALS